MLSVPTLSYHRKPAKRTFENTQSEGPRNTWKKAGGKENMKKKGGRKGEREKRRKNTRLPAIEAVMKQAMLAATRVLIANFAMSLFLVCANGPSPPRSTPRPKKLLKPHNA